jgi:hypothetical protein
MSGCSMLEQAATCPAATCLNPLAATCPAATCSNRLHFVTTSHFYRHLDVILVALPTKLKIFSAVDYIAKKI